jgi:hypothetical protein
MKKLLVAILFGALVCSLSVFAEAVATEYIVQSVTGKVELEASSDNLVVVTEGMKLAPSAVISTALNSNLILKAGDKVVTIKALQKGTIEKLASGTSSAKAGIKLGAKATTTDVTAESGQTRSNVSTASTRASDATKDVEWEQ